MASITLLGGLPEKAKTILQPNTQATKLVLTETPLPVPSNTDDLLVRVHATAPMQWRGDMSPNQSRTVPERQTTCALSGHGRYRRLSTAGFWFRRWRRCLSGDALRDFNGHAQSRGAFGQQIRCIML